MTVAFFSSDARELYKADIYRALALPTGYVLHFRYPKEFIHQDILSNLPSLLTRPSAIFYVSGNDTTRPPDERQVTQYSIRHVRVLDFADNASTSTIHFYLQLDEFFDAQPMPATDRRILPPYIFVAEVQLNPGPNATWRHRVDAIRADFQNMPFFRIERITEKKASLADRVRAWWNKQPLVETPLVPTYSTHTKRSSYALADESNYVVHVTLYDPGPGNTGLAVENSSEDVTLAVPPQYRVGAQEDTQNFELLTHSLSRSTESALSRLTGVSYAATAPAPNAPDYRVQLDWQVSKGRSKTYAFGILSAIAALGLGVAKLATDDLQKANLAYGNAILGLLALLFIGASGALFYAFFNKK